MAGWEQPTYMTNMRVALCLVGLRLFRRPLGEMWMNCNGPITVSHLGKALQEVSAAAGSAGRVDSVAFHQRPPPTCTGCCKRH